MPKPISQKQRVAYQLMKVKRAYRVWMNTKDNPELELNRFVRCCDAMEKLVVIKKQG